MSNGLQIAPASLQLFSAVSIKGPHVEKHQNGRISDACAATALLLNSFHSHCFTGWLLVFQSRVSLFEATLRISAANFSHALSYEVRSRFEYLEYFLFSRKSTLFHLASKVGCLGHFSLVCAHLIIPSFGIR